MDIHCALNDIIPALIRYNSLIIHIYKFQYLPTIINDPLTTISSSILEDLETFIADAGQVIIHGIVYGRNYGTNIRIWPSTYLFDKHSSHRSELVHFEKISAFPHWTEIPANHTFYFTLIFSGLPSSCKLFELKEVIPQSGGFYIPDIMRNKEDIYFLEF